MKRFKSSHRRYLLSYGFPFLIYSVFLLTFLLNIFDHICNSPNTQWQTTQVHYGRLSSKRNVKDSETSRINDLKNVNYDVGNLLDHKDGDVTRQRVYGVVSNERERMNYSSCVNNSLSNHAKDVISPRMMSNLREWLSLFSVKENSTNILVIAHQTGPEVEEFRQTFSKDTTVFYNIEKDIEEEISAALEGDIYHPLQQYKSPCWKTPLLNVDDMYYRNPFYRQNMDGTSVARLDSYRHKFKTLSKLGLDYRLRCLPSVYIAGVTKSGTSDFIHVLRTLPGLLDPAVKESMYWTRVRLGRLLRSNFKHYIDLFDGLGLELMTKSNQSITYDATPSYLWDFFSWPQLPGNKGLVEPKYILAHTLRALYPDTKIIIFLRNPIQRLYSHYRMWHAHHPAEDFNSRVEEAVRRLTNCLRRFPVRACLYGKYSQTSTNRVCRFMSASMYYLYIKDWLAVFPRHQVLVIKAEEYYEDRIPIVEEVIAFLGLGKLNPDLVEIIRKMKPVNSRRKSGRSLEPMMNSTLSILKQVYKPLNKRLADLLSDKKWHWNGLQH